MAVRRNTETFLSSVMPARDIGPFLYSLAANRWEMVDEETEEFLSEKTLNDLPGIEHTVPSLTTSLFGLYPGGKSCKEPLKLTGELLVKALQVSKGVGMEAIIEQIVNQKKEQENAQSGN